MSENHAYLLDKKYSDKETEDQSYWLVRLTSGSTKAFALHVRLRRIFVPYVLYVNLNVADSDNRNMISYETDENSIYVNRILY